MRWRLCPPIVSKMRPPNLPIGLHCDRDDRIVRVRVERISRPVVASSRAIQERDCPPIVSKVPPAKTLPSACNAIA